MRLPVCLFIALLCLAYSQAAATKAVKADIFVYQNDSENDKDVLLFADTALFLPSMPSTGFMSAMSLEVEVTEMDSSGVRLSIQVVTSGLPSFRAARNFAVEYGLPARIDQIKGKNGASYSLVIRPLASIDVDTSNCSWDHRDRNSFKYDPSANVDIYYVGNSLGDFYWTSVKSLVEEEYRAYQKMLRSTLPGKYRVYLCPCAQYSVIWDKRFGVAVDPVRSTVYTIYTKEFNSCDPVTVNLVATMRLLGYAPPFLAEGVAAVRSPAISEMKRILDENKAVPISVLLDSYTYMNTDARLAEASAASFARFLIDRFGFDRFRQLYQAADDLNVQQKIEELYESDIALLENEWLTFVDTLTLTPRDFAWYGDRSETMFDYRAMLVYAQKQFEISATRTDSVDALRRLKRARFFVGDYYGAAEAQQELIDRFDSSASSLMTLASYRMMNGLYKEAQRDLQHAAIKDSLNQIIRFNQALNSMFHLDTLAARQSLEQIVSFGRDAGAQGEARVLLGQLLMISEKETDRARAAGYLNEAISIFAQQLQVHNSAADARLWTGIALVELGDTGAGQDYLDAALFLETRPFYLGMTNLWLGKLADLRGEREAAEQFYSQTLALPSADYHQKEATAYLKEPFHR
ncbi:MAG: tetratricopeptide repeat protein [Candidatus Zixiibacteriota bacterium]